MFKFLFHLITIGFIINEIMWIINPVKQVKNTKKYFKLNKKHKGKSWDDWSEDYKTLFLSKGLPSIIFFIWMVLGLFTFNWILFGIHLIFGISIVLPISRPFRFNTVYLIIHWISSVIGFIFGVFVLINSYHLKIDLYQIVKSWF